MYTVSQIMERYRVAVNTVLRWFHAGQLASVQPSQNGIFCHAVTFHNLADGVHFWSLTKLLESHSPKIYPRFFPGKLFPGNFSPGKQKTPETRGLSGEIFFAGKVLGKLIAGYAQLFADFFGVWFTSRLFFLICNAIDVIGFIDIVAAVAAAGIFLAVFSGLRVAAQVFA